MKVPSRASSSIPVVYRVVFLYLEPATILIGAYLALFQPTTYLSTVHALSSHSDPGSEPTSAAPTVAVLLAQLANVYVLFALLEGTMLRASDDLDVWRTFLRAAMVADFGHLLIVTGRGVEVSWAMLGRLAELGVADWGKPLLMIVLRAAFLYGVGLRREPKSREGKSLKTT